MPIEYTPFHMSLEGINVRAGHKVLLVVDLYFTGCWQFIRDFRPAAQASPDLCINCYYFYLFYYYRLLNLEYCG